jgi:translation initiation factor IF-3
MPPVCKIMDYGKFKYEDAKKRKEARKHQSTIEYKEVKFRPKTDDHDFDFKVKNIRRFLGEGNKARLVVVFRGREIVHPETGQDMLKQVFEATSDIAMIEQAPLMEGRRMLMVIAPKGGVIKRAPNAPAPATGSSPAPPAAPVVAKPAGK